MSKVLIVGGAGFIGSHVADELLKQGYEVVILDDLSRGFRENLSEEVKFIQGDVTEDKFIFDLFENEKFDYVYSLAAQSAIGLSNFIKNYNYGVNVMGNINLINASVKYDIKCFVFLSSIGVYGYQKPPFDEETSKPDPQDPYSISKYTIEKELEATHRMFGLDYVIFRPYNVYGERQDIGDRYRNVVGIFMKQTLEGNPITLVGEGEQKFAFTHVLDISEVIARAPFVEKARNQIFNIGAEPQPNSLKELAKEICEAMEVELKVVNIPKRKEAPEAFSSIEKAKRLFEWAPKINLKEGILRTSKWVKETGVRRVIDYVDVEIDKNLPPSWVKKRDI